MKKVVASMLAMLLVLSMGTTVFAAKSPDSQAALEELAKQWDSNVSDVSAYNSNIIVNISIISYDEPVFNRFF